MKSLNTDPSLEPLLEKYYIPFVSRMMLMISGDSAKPEVRVTICTDEDIPHQCNLVSISRLEDPRIKEANALPLRTRIAIHLLMTKRVDLSLGLIGCSIGCKRFSASA